MSTSGVLQGSHRARFVAELIAIARELEELVIAGLDAESERAEVALIPASVIHFGTGATVEIDCRLRPSRTPERMKSLAEAVHTRLAPLAERLIHGSGSRILMFDDDRAFGIN